MSDNPSFEEQATPQRTGKYPLLPTMGIGLGAGLLNGLLGIGGGIIIVPGLIIIRNLQPRSAVSTSLGSVLFLAAIAFSAHIFISGFQFSIAGSLFLLLAGVIGSQIGGILLKRISQRSILFIFSVFAMLSSLYLILQGVNLIATPEGGPR